MAVGPRAAATSLCPSPLPLPSLPAPALARHIAPSTEHTWPPVSGPVAPLPFPAAPPIQAPQRERGWRPGLRLLLPFASSSPLACVATAYMALSLNGFEPVWLFASFPSFACMAIACMAIGLCGNGLAALLGLDLLGVHHPGGARGPRTPIHQHPVLHLHKVKHRKGHR